MNWSRSANPIQSLISIAVVSSLALGGCAITPSHNPQPKNYAVSFSVDNRLPFLTAIKGQYQTQFDVNVSDWSQSYNRSSCEVFLIVTDNSHAPVIDLETNNPHHFASGGWFDLDVESRALESLRLQPFPAYPDHAGNWFNVMDATRATSKFIARTRKQVNPKDWRFVVMAIQSGHGSVKVLWTKVVSPSPRLG